MSTILTGQVTIAQANTARALGSLIINDVVHVKALPSNAGVVFVGNNGSDTVASGTGYPLSAGQEVEFYVGDLGDIFVVSTNVGDRVCWARHQV